MWNEFLCLRYIESFEKETGFIDYNRLINDGIREHNIIWGLADKIRFKTYKTTLIKFLNLDEHRLLKNVYSTEIEKDLKLTTKVVQKCLEDNLIKIKTEEGIHRKIWITREGQRFANWIGFINEVLKKYGAVTSFLFGALFSIIIWIIIHYKEIVNVVNETIF